MRKVSLALLLLLTCAVAGGVVYLAEHDVPIKNAGTTPSDTFVLPPPVPTSTSAPTTGSSSGGGVRSDGSSTSPAAPKVMKITFLGDDYTVGLGASPRSKAWTHLVGKRLGVHVTVLGEDGAGYAKKSADGKSYSAMLNTVEASAPDLVVVSGGRNDIGDDPSTLHAAAHTLFSTLHQKLPNARLLAIAPWWGDSPHPGGLTAVDQAVRSAVRAAGGKYLAKPDPLDGHPGFMHDAADPNNQGYRAIADSVSAAIGAQLPR